MKVNKSKSNGVRWHINHENMPGICQAKCEENCPFKKHFDNQQDAYSAGETLSVLQSLVENEEGKGDKFCQEHMKELEIDNPFYKESTEPIVWKPTSKSEAWDLKISTLEGAKERKEDSLKKIIDGDEGYKKYCANKNNEPKTLEEFMEYYDTLSNGKHSTLERYRNACTTISGMLDMREHNRQVDKLNELIEPKSIKYSPSSDSTYFLYNTDDYDKLIEACNELGLDTTTYPDFENIKGKTFVFRLSDHLPRVAYNSKNEVIATDEEIWNGFGMATVCAEYNKENREIEPFDSVEQLEKHLKREGEKIDYQKKNGMLKDYELGHQIGRSNWQKEFKLKESPFAKHIQKQIKKTNGSIEKRIKQEKEKENPDKDMILKCEKAIKRNTARASILLLQYSDPSVLGKGRKSFTDAEKQGLRFEYVSGGEFKRKDFYDSEQIIADIKAKEEKEKKERRKAKKQQKKKGK